MNEPRAIRRLLVANRGEISIRVQRAATELGVGTVAVFSQEDRFALHRFKADEAYRVGKGRTPVQAYLDVDDLLRIADLANCDGVHPGYGFLAEKPGSVRRRMSWKHLATKWRRGRWRRGRVFPCVRRPDRCRATQAPCAGSRKKSVSR
jgi:hypothetical protein